MARESGAKGDGAAIADTSLDAAADALYALPADEFTAARNARAKQARDAGARELAAEIGKLTKPTAAAWLANQLARDDGDRIASFVGLGQAMRDATAARDRDELRRLTREQRDATAGLVRRAREVAEAAGQRVNDQAVRALEETLHAALVDEDAARELAAGRLTGTLQSSGFPLGDAMVVTSTRTVPRPAKAPSKPPARKDRTTAKSDEPDRARARAEAEFVEAMRVRDEAHDAKARADEALRTASADVDRLRTELDRAMTVKKRADNELKTARAAADRADHEAERLARRLGREQPAPPPNEPDDRPSTT
jgi:hypothetical protein